MTPDVLHRWLEIARIIRRRGLVPFAVVLATLIVPAFSLADPIQAPARLYASWRAPFGYPRATDSLFASCNDTLRADTLYLSFDFRRPVPSITVLKATVYFRPQPGDSLGDFWSFKSGSANEKSLYIDFAPYEGGGCPIAWMDPGIYQVRYDRWRGGGRLDLTYYIPIENTVAVDPDIHYCFGRVRILHRRSYLSGCGQPVLIEWGSANFGFATGREAIAIAGENRALRWNAGPSVDFGLPRSNSMAKPWVPKTR